MDNPSYFAFPDKEDAAPEAGPCSQSAPGRVWADGGGGGGGGRCRQPESPRRREVRALLRSLSAREPDEAEAFLRGQPRPGDRAPPDMRHTFTAPRIKKGKITSSVVTATGVEEREEVFYTVPLAARRRHSTGGYLLAGGGGAGEVTLVPSEVPAAPPPRPDDGGGRRRARAHASKEMEDITILSSSGSPESALWAEYLVCSFDKIMSQRARHHYRVSPMTVEELGEELGAEAAAARRTALARAQLQIVIMCPRLAARLGALAAALGADGAAVLRAERVLVMLLGVERDDVVRDNCEEFPHIARWQMMSVREKDPTFVDTFLTAAVGVLRTKDCRDGNTDRTGFSIVPKKIKTGQNRVIALLNEPAREEDSLRIVVEKKGEVIHVPTYKRRNPYTLQFDIPESCLEVSMLVMVRVSKNGQWLGRRQVKCESRLRELEQLLRSADHPLQFMCQTLGFKQTSREQLDEWLAAALRRALPPALHVLAAAGDDAPAPPRTSGEEFPTLLHWAARHGLERLSWALLALPGAAAAAALRNARGLCPAALAREARHAALAHSLDAHRQMNEFSNTYYYLKNMSENNDAPAPADPAAPPDADPADPCDPSDPGPDPVTPTTPASPAELRIVEERDTVDAPDPFSEACTRSLELQPPPRPDQLYMNDPRDPRDDGRVRRALEHDYLVQPSNIRVTAAPPAAPPAPPAPQYTNARAQLLLYSPTEESRPPPGAEPDRAGAQPDRAGRDAGAPRLNSQDELAEIITDFKNNVFSIGEVEKLVSEWRSRHETRHTLREQRDQLERMRREYERIQRRLKAEHSRPTPFERVRSLFSRKAKQRENGGSGGGGGGACEGGVEPRGTRPSSSLSESSSSSGRLSSLSGGSSGGDAHLAVSHGAGAEPAPDYLVPPPPRALGGFPHARSQQMATIVERDACGSRERLDDRDHDRDHDRDRDRDRDHDHDRDRDRTHVLMHFRERRRDAGHMYMNVSAAHT